MPTGDGLSATPEEPMMHDENLGTRLGGRLNCGETGIHGDRHFRDGWSARINLKPVQGVGMIRDINNAELDVERGHQLAELQ
jgi:hypothetical protein